jgi:hypothetical protein
MPFNEVIRCPEVMSLPRSSNLEHSPDIVHRDRVQRPAAAGQERAGFSIEQAARRLGVTPAVYREARLAESRCSKATPRRPDRG